MKYTLRIKNKKVFKYVLRNGRYSRGKYVVVHISKTKFNNDNINNGKNFFAVCVSKKNGNSVQRNKLKRWAREVYKIEEEKLKIGYNLVILYKKNTRVDETNFNLLYEDLKECFSELDLYE